MKFTTWSLLTQYHCTNTTKSIISAKSFIQILNIIYHKLGIHSEMNNNSLYLKDFGYVHVNSNRENIPQLLNVNKRASQFSYQSMNQINKYEINNKLRNLL